MTDRTGSPVPDGGLQLGGIGAGDDEDDPGTVAGALDELEPQMITRAALWCEGDRERSVRSTSVIVPITTSGAW